MSAEAIDRLLAEGPSALPRRNGELVFAAPWEGRAFGVVLALAQQEVCDWEEFRGLLIDEIAAWERDHPLDAAQWSYYERWLEALERLMSARRILAPEEIEARVCRLEREQAHEHDHEHDHGHHH